MTASDELASDWPKEVIRFLSKALPPFDYGEGWGHFFMTAYELGCDALVALGQADETDRGAAPRAHPRLPNLLPRWDDICVVVLSVAAQNNLLEFRLADGNITASTTADFNLIEKNPAPIAAPNIATSQGLGPAHAAPEILPLLQSLNLVAKGRWTRAAETVLWRDEPTAWSMDIASDPRFSQAVKQACETMPDDIRAEAMRLVVITEADIADAKVRLLADIEKMCAEIGPHADIRSDITPEGLRKSLESSRSHALDWLFFRRWRLADGWLTPEEEKRTVAIFHDPLAIAMRRAVVGRLFPDHFL